MASPTVISVLNRCENSILNSFQSMYDFVNSHNGNKKVSKKDLIELFDENVKSIITNIEKQKTNDDNSNVDSNVNIILKDILSDSLIPIEVNDGHSYPNDINTVSNEVNEEVIENGENYEIKDKIESMNERLIRIEKALNMKTNTRRPHHWKERPKHWEGPHNQNNDRDHNRPKPRFKTRVYNRSDGQNNRNQKFSQSYKNGFRPQNHSSMQLNNRSNPRPKYWSESSPTYWSEPSPTYWAQPAIGPLQSVSQTNGNNYQILSQPLNGNHFLGQNFTPILRQF